MMDDEGIPINSSLWGFAPDTVELVYDPDDPEKNPEVKPVYGSFIREVFKWPKHYEVTYHFIVKANSGRES